MRDSYIAPCGKVNLETGKFPYGNIYGFWGEDTTYELYRVSETGRLRIVATAGMEPICPVGNRNLFRHDQTGKILWSGVVIETASSNAGLKSFMKHQKVIAIATYK
jgi:hypothetical protein